MIATPIIAPATGRTLALGRWAPSSSCSAGARTAASSRSRSHSARCESEDGTLVSSAIRDISTRKQVEDELRHSRERLAEAEQVARIGSGEWDLTNDHTTWSDGLLPRSTGSPPTQFDPSSEGANNASTQTTENSSGEPSTKRSQSDRRSRSNTARSAPTAESARCAASGEVVVDDSGEPIRVVAIVQDITDAKLAQEALQSTSADLERRANELQQFALRTATEPPAHTARTAHRATARDPPAHRPRPHQRGDRRTTRRHRRHDQVARQKDPRQDQLNQPHRSRRPRPRRTPIRTTSHQPTCAVDQRRNVQRPERRHQRPPPSPLCEHWLVAGVGWSPRARGCLVFRTSYKLTASFRGWACESPAPHRRMGLVRRH